VTKVADLINKIRYILVDAPNLQEARGWSDERFIDLIDEAQKDICTTARIFKREHYLSLAKGVYSYPLPDDFISADRFTTWNAKLPELTMNDMDERSISWRLDEANYVEAIIQDSVNMNFLEIYPKPNAELTYTPFYTVVSFENKWYFVLQNTDGVLSDTLPDVALYDPVEGVYLDATGSAELANLTDMEYATTLWGTITDVYGNVGTVRTLYPNQRDGVLTGVDARAGATAEEADLWGVITDVNQAAGMLGGTWGVVTSTTKSESVVKVRYSALPEELKYETSNLALPDKWATAIKYYVAGYALLDDNDAKNNEKGIMFIGKYDTEKDKLTKLGNSTTATKSATAYRGINRVPQLNTRDY